MIPTILMPYVYDFMLYHVNEVMDCVLPLYGFYVALKNKFRNSAH